MINRVKSIIESVKDEDIKFYVSNHLNNFIIRDKTFNGIIKNEEAEIFIQQFEMWALQCNLEQMSVIK